MLMPHPSALTLYNFVMSLTIQEMHTYLYVLWIQVGGNMATSNLILRQGAYSPKPKTVVVWKEKVLRSHTVIIQDFN